LNFELFFAQKIISKHRSGFSNPIVRLGVLSIALGLALMILSVAIVTGFQTQIRDKIVGFGSHIQIAKYELSNSYESLPVSKNQTFYPLFRSVPDVTHIQCYAYKAGIIKTENQIEAVVLKGVGSDYDWSFFKDKILQGKHFTVKDSVKTNDILISEQLARKLSLRLNDAVQIYFIQDPPRMRKFKITGIYKTGLEDFDRRYAFIDIGHIQKLNNWGKDSVGGFELLVKDFGMLDQINEKVKRSLNYTLSAKSIKEIYPEQFEWLNIINVNVFIILSLMIIVAGISVISTMLILILERTNTIGILKALGTRNRSIRIIFIYNAVYITLKGLFWGNLIAIGLCILQLKTGFVKLDQASYYMATVPVNFNFTHIFLINAGTVVICTLMLIIPSYIISRVTPVKAIRFS